VIFTWILGIVLVLAVLVLLLTVLLGLYVNDTKVDTTSLETKNIKILLAIFAHPDDEVMVAGTLSKLKKQGTAVHLLYLTHGEDGPTSGIVEQSKLGELRAVELQQVKAVLQADTLDILDFPDRYLNTIAEETLAAAICDKIARYRPDTIICFDETIGLYGNSDHAYSGKVVHKILSENLGSLADSEKANLQNLLIMTLPQPMINLAMKVSKTFRERYDVKNGLPAANFAVKIRRFGGQKKQVVGSHKTQAVVMNDVQPMWEKIPYWLYYRIFSREYFCWVDIKKFR